jgi:integrase
MQVTIKERLQSSGNKTLYLEYYETGFRKRENLHITIYPESFRGAKKLNKEAYAKAQTIRSERVLNPPTFLKVEDKADERAKTMTWKQWARDNIEYGVREGNVKKQIDHKKAVSKRIDEYLEKNNYGKLLLKDVKAEHISGLYDYMRNDYRNSDLIKQNDGKLSPFSLMLFGQTVNAMFNRAYREGLILCNPVGGLSSLEKFPVPDTHREYLTAEELERFLHVDMEECSERIAQKAFGFACFTALRLSDMRRLRWSNIKPLGDGLCVQICQQKTKNWVTVPLNEMALSLLPERPDIGEDAIIFPLSKKPDWVATLIRRICAKAGIDDKDITFHCARHTAASLAISTGADISTVSKILGHKSTTCTQVYAKVSLESRIEVMNLTDGVFD